ncbi:ferrichrome ABC transporter substrate-binding protein [Paenibacillus sp. FSL A5-0031]|uniref:ABC transporter substrate-binding protein n=1 Tax=Paenibacillus sp. FSL A5-0031 TaxID=1920420 RepID=UPI00096FA4FB|nr:ABC transporter substrate-binding protein [Paenibacillus sp. FSL A5-0031]OME85147.1 ferrichrome ABC transporter substrate-binding protein [Paenibacillus sp. FSL A5-0031]
MFRHTGSRSIIVRGLISLLIVFMALTGCSTAQEEKKEAANKGNAVNTQTDKAAENGKEVKTNENETHVVKDFFGEVEIPVKPKRIAAIYLEDYLVTLGVEPVVQWYHPMWGKQEYLNLDVPPFDITGSIEALLDAEPDLIITDGFVDEAIYEKYSKVAPTFRMPDDILMSSSSDILLKIADLIGEQEKAEKLVKDYEQKIADTKSKLKAAIGDESVAVLRLNIGETDLNLLGIKNKFVGSILYKELGLTPPKMVADMEAFIETISMEKLPDLNADHIIILTSNGSWSSPENQESIKNLFDSPIWQSVPAIKKGNVYQVDRTYWQTGAFTANQLKIKDLEKVLLK